VFEIDVDGRDEFLAVEEGPNGDFDTIDAALELEDFDFVGKSFFVRLEHANDVFAVFFLTDKEAALDVLGFAAGLNDVAIGIFLDEFDGGIEGVEFLIGDDGDAGFLQLFLTERAVVFEIVGVRGTTDDRLAGLAEGLGFGALTKGVVEDDDIGPLAIFFIVAGFGNEAVGNVAFFFVFDVVADFVALFHDLPGDISDEAGKRGKEEFLFLHARVRPLLGQRLAFYCR